MSIFKKAKQLLMLIVVLLLAFSCSKDSKLDKTILLAQENFVDLSLAKEIASVISYPELNKGLKPKSSNTSTKNISRVDEFKNKGGKISFYIINYKEGGFVILSADKRTQPILGYSSDNEFIVDENTYPSGLKFWINDALEQIYNIQNSNIEQSELEKHVWKLVQESKSYGLKSAPPDDSCYAHTEIYTKGPLTSTLWHQLYGFNNLLPTMSCSGYNVPIFAGCTPIAMAQIMKYHQFPSTYDWASMPLDYGTAATQNLIKDIHTAIGNVYSGQPTHDCLGTYVSTSADMGYVLRTRFGYSSATKASYNYSTVVSNLSNNLPVILRGDDGSGNAGHMWVCDGYRTTSYYFDDCTGITYLHFRMNWGFYNGQNNGWFAFDNFNPGNSNYNGNKGMIYNIIP